ncbi:hypothetical protein QE152_g4337 [Popillia japonica]|uniref:Ribosomal protein S21 n=1 Tax=Popillia japonica TaxID=7064 RepID=A0AAW1N133_POPJA
MRLGGSQNKPRPLRVVFNNPHVVSDIVRQKHKLKVMDQYKKIFLKRNETNHQRTLFKKCQEELKQRKLLGEKDISIRYVDGVPRVLPSTGQTYHHEQLSKTNSESAEKN